MAGFNGFTQELYVYSEPASNMPSHSLSAKLSFNSGNNNSDRGRRYTGELMFGFNKNFMMHIGTTVSNMHTANTRWESVYAYGKYRFLSNDDVHKHFRMAAFGEITKSRNEYHYDEVSIQGDRSGVQLGVIATQLINKFAASATVSHTQAFDPSRKNKSLYSPERTYQSMNYSLSAGLLLLPREYKNYNQLNMNLYAELLGQKTFERGLHFMDLAMALQFIFNSNTKLNLGYRTQLNGNQRRGMTEGALVSLEHTFFNALKKKKR